MENKALETRTKGSKVNSYNVIYKYASYMNGSYSLVWCRSRNSLETRVG